MHPTTSSKARPIVSTPDFFDPHVSAPYFFQDAYGKPSPPDPDDLAPIDYLQPGVTTQFPAGHRLAGKQTDATKEPMRRELFSLFVRCGYNRDRFEDFLRHPIRDLDLPFSSAHITMSNAWVYDDGVSHTGFDINDQPFREYSYPDHTTRTNFAVHAMAPGTVVGWDGTKLLILEHHTGEGELFRSLYNHMRDVPVEPITGGVITLGRSVGRGERIGEVWNPDDRRIHLHFAVFLPHTASPPPKPDPGRLFAELEGQFGVVFTPSEQRIVGSLIGKGPRRFREWYPIDPFGCYDHLWSAQPGYGPLVRSFYYPVPVGIGPYAFRNTSLAGEPGGDGIPLFAGNDDLLANLSVGPLSMATLCALGE
jgi:hypothetical protein